MSRHSFIAAERGQYPVRRLCQVLGVESIKKCGAIGLSGHLQRFRWH